MLLVARNRSAHLHVQPQNIPGQYTNEPLRKSKKAVQSQPNQVYAKLMLLSVFFLIAVFLVSHYAQIVSTNYEIHQLERALSNLEGEQKHLQLEVSRLSSLERIEGLAYEMGLQKVQDNQLVYLDIQR